MLGDAADNTRRSVTPGALFNVSRSQRSVVNDTDRLRKYWLKFGLSWDLLSRHPR